MLRGLEQFDAALRKLTEDVSHGKKLRRAVVRSVQSLIDRAAADSPYRTGGLSRSETVQITSDIGTSVVARVGSGFPSGAHGILVEFGTVHMTPRPFLASAYGSTREEIIAQMKIELADLIGGEAAEEI